MTAVISFEALGDLQKRLWTKREEYTLGMYLGHFRYLYVTTQRHGKCHFSAKFSFKGSDLGI